MLIDIHAIASLLQQAGQQILLPLFSQQNIQREHKQDHSIVTEADLRCQTMLQKKLSDWALTHAPAINFGFLGEEMSTEMQQACLQESETFWCIDPLDGTGNFADGIPLFTISLALIHQGRPIAAWIHDPIRQETFTASLGGGICLNGHRLQSKTPCRDLEQLSGFIDFKRLSDELARHLVTHNIYRSQRNLGSCALEWAWLAAGRGGFIIHGQQKLWDYAAGLLLCEEAGCKVTSFTALHPFESSQLSSSIVATRCANLHQGLLKQCNKS